MFRFSVGWMFFVPVAAISVYAAELTAIIAKVSANCDRIVTFSADAKVRYRI